MINAVLCTTARTKGGAIYAGGRYPYSEDEDEHIPTYGSEIYDSGRLGFATITDSIIENNWADQYGGGIVFEDFSEEKVRNCIISNNSVTKGSYIILPGAVLL